MEVSNKPLAAIALRFLGVNMHGRINPVRGRLQPVDRYLGGGDVSQKNYTRTLQRLCSRWQWPFVALLVVERIYSPFIL